MTMVIFGLTIITFLFNPPIKFSSLVSDETTDFFEPGDTVIYKPTGHIYVVAKHLYDDIYVIRRYHHEGYIADDREAYEFELKRKSNGVTESSVYRSGYYPWFNSYYLLYSGPYKLHRSSDPTPNISERTDNVWIFGSDNYICLSTPVCFT